MAPSAFPPPRLVEALLRVARDRPLERKILVAPTFGGGRELLRRLARAGRGWVGFEVTTPRLLALRLARRESLILNIRGARNGRVVSQIPVPGTLLDGDDRTVRLQLAATREEG